MDKIDSTRQSNSLYDKIAYLRVGNTFEQISEEEASWDRTGRFKKIYRVSVYVDVVEGNEKIIHDIKADYGETFLRPFNSVFGKKIQLEQNDEVKSRWRFFENTQDMYGMIDIKFTITGIGGTESTIRYTTKGRDYEEPWQFFELKLSHVA